MGTSSYCTPPPLRLSAGICTVCLSIYLSLTDKNEIQNIYENSRKMAQWVAPIIKYSKVFNLWLPPIRQLLSLLYNYKGVFHKRKGRGGALCSPQFILAFSESSE